MTKQARQLKKRYRQEKRFRFYGILAITLSLLTLSLLIGNIALQSRGAFTQSFVLLDIDLSPEKLGVEKEQAIEAVRNGDVHLSKLISHALYDLFPDVTKRRDKRDLKKIVSNQGSRIFLRDYILNNPENLGKIQPIWILLSDDVDQYLKQKSKNQKNFGVTKKQISWISDLEKTNRIDTKFNFDFFSTGDSSLPELAGIWGAIVGSFYTMFVTLILSFPLAVAAGVYLEEFAPKNAWTDFIEVNINNLAAVPSIIFGLLGLAIFIQLFGLPRSAPLVGGMVLTLMTLPTIIIATRVSLKSVPYSIREAALGLGASPFQAVFHHALPLAMPGILTGTIIGMARALGETAPLLMIGMVAFIVDIPQTPLDSSTALPVQIFLWADKPERGFVAKTAAAILILLAFLMIMNATAIYLRKKFEKKW